MFLNVDQLEKQLDNKEFQEIGSMASFKTTEEKVDSSKTLDASLVIIESNGTESQKQDTSSRSGNDAHDISIGGILNLNNEEGILNSNSVNTKFAKPSILGKPVLQPHGNQFVVRQPTAFKSERPKISKERFASQVDVSNDLSKPVTTHYLPKRRGILPCKTFISGLQLAHLEVNSRAKVPSNKTTTRNKPVEQTRFAKKPERQISKGHMFSIKNTSVDGFPTERYSPLAQIRMTVKPPNVRKGVSLTNVGKRTSYFDISQKTGLRNFDSVYDIKMVSAENNHFQARSKLFTRDVDRMQIKPRTRNSRPHQLNVKFKLGCQKLFLYQSKTSLGRQELDIYILPPSHIANAGDNSHKVVRLGINPMIQPEPEDLPKDNPKLEIAVLRMKKKCMDKGSKERSPPHNLRQKPGQYICCQNHMLIADIEDDIMDPVMQCTTLPSHSGFSQQKLVSFVTEIHMLSIDISFRDR
ncbi:hypothetical protein Tco_0838494 [Tanacetum coccineum]|uniref:Uncharacterized protein n=1 Tax=Tanacetum coccineum TaxID=301880 RepID=A0ABQ5AR68_9ASTR